MVGLKGAGKSSILKNLDLGTIATETVSTGRSDARNVILFGLPVVLGLIVYKCNRRKRRDSRV